MPRGPDAKWRLRERIRQRAARPHRGSRTRRAGEAFPAGVKLGLDSRAMIRGAHFLFYSTDPEADRAFLRDVLGFPAVDAGEGWLIFKLPPAEVGVHPSEGPFVQRHADRELLGAILYLMCDDLPALVASLEARGVACAPLDREEWGEFTSCRLPSGAWIGLYRPTHPTAIGL